MIKVGNFTLLNSTVDLGESSKYIVKKSKETSLFVTVTRAIRTGHKTSSWFRIANNGVLEYSQRYKREMKDNFRVIWMGPNKKGKRMQERQVRRIVVFVKSRRTWNRRGWKFSTQPSPDIHKVRNVDLIHYWCWKWRKFPFDKRELSRAWNVEEPQKKKRLECARWDDMSTHSADVGRKWICEVIRQRVNEQKNRSISELSTRISRISGL